MSDPQRRQDDPRIEQLVDDMAAMKTAHAAMKISLDQNTEVTTQIRDILTSFRVLRTLAIWLSGLLAAVGASWAAIRQIKGGG
jgi:hypothetical protein